MSEGAPVQVDAFAKTAGRQKLTIAVAPVGRPGYRLINRSVGAPLIRSATMGTEPRRRFVQQREWAVSLNLCSVWASSWWLASGRARGARDGSSRAQPQLYGWEVNVETRAVDSLRGRARQSSR